jgi:hypothetical protein
MQEKEVTTYPFVTLNTDGTFAGIGVYSFKTKDEVTEYSIRIGLEPVTLKVQVPDDEQLLKGALALVGVEQEKLKTELQGKLIFLEQVKNSLLRLEMSEGVEVLDAVDKPRRPDLRIVPDADDDIPF